MISQADLIEFDHIEKDNNDFDEDNDQNVDKKYSDISQINRGNSFEHLQEKKKVSKEKL